MVWSGAVSGALSTSDNHASFSAQVTFDGELGLTGIVTHLNYDDQANLKLMVDLNFQPYSCSSLSVGSGSMKLYPYYC